MRIRLTRDEWKIVDEQCGECKYWSEAGCRYSPADPIPLANCDCFVWKAERVIKSCDGGRHDS